MFKQLTAVTLTALALGACSMEAASSEDLGTQQAALTGGQCGISGLEWKPFLAHLAYDAAEDFGRWEFTTDLYINGDRLAISSTGLALCASRGRTGCPSVTAGLGAQEGNGEVQNSAGKVIINPSTIRSQLVTGWTTQANYELNQQWLDDPSEVAPYNHFQAATKTGLPHTVALTNCAATIYANTNYGGASQCLRAGNYRMADLTAGVGNDKLSSIKVRAGMKVTMYNNDSFGGTNMVATADTSSLGSFDNKISSMVVSATDTSLCSAIDTFKVSVASGDWTKIRGKLITLGWDRGNSDLLDLRIDKSGNTIDVDPFNVDFVPPSQIGGTTYGVSVKSDTAETWRTTEDPAPSIFQLGAVCKKKNYGGTSWFNGIVKSMGTYRYCYSN
jgi:hypothetical protein